MNQVTPIPKGSGLTKPMTKGEVFRTLSQNIPLNQYHLPDHIYRADLIGLDVLELSAKDRLNVLDSASMPVTMEHGYPALNETQPFWEQLPCEPPDAYNAYMTFLELPEKSAHNNPIRLLPIIATLTNETLDQIAEWAHQFYWHWRARAYDLFLIACHRKQREQRIMSVEGQHFKQAEGLLAKVQAIAVAKLDQEIRALTTDQDAETDTKLKDLISMVKDLMGIQRISIGLPAAGPSQIDLKLDGPRHTTVDETFKSIAKEGAGEAKPNQRSAEMDALLQDPDDLSRVQELLIKMTSPQHTLPAWGDGSVVEILEKTRPQSSASGKTTNADGGGQRRTDATESDTSDTIVEDMGNPDV